MVFGIQLANSQTNYSKQRINPLFDGLRRRTYQYVHRRIRKHDGVLFKKFKLRYCFLVKQQKEAYELKSTNRVNFFTIYTQYNRIYLKVETQFTYIQWFYIYGFTYIHGSYVPTSSWFIRSNQQLQDLLLSMLSLES